MIIVKAYYNQLMVLSIYLDMKLATLVVLFGMLLSLGQCMQQQPKQSFDSPNIQKKKATQYFDKTTTKWHRQLQREMDAKVNYLQSAAAHTHSLKPSTTDPKDVKAMVALYTSTNGQTWINNTGWMKGDPCNDMWQGLYCLNGRVLQINLVYNNMTGVLPAEMAEADMLQVVRLYSNRLTGTIPDEILKMKNLQILDLDSNRLTGSISRSISMPNLTELILFANQLTGTFPSLTETPQLQMLEISSNMFKGEFPDLSLCTKLQVLVASRNNFTGDYPSSLGELQSLKTLWLFNNQFDQPQIPSSWNQLISLEDIELDGVYGKIPSYIGTSWTKLIHLVIIDGALEGEFSVGLCNLQQLQDLRLFQNKLSNSLPTCVCNMRNLQIFEMSDNQLNGSIPYCMGSLVKLTDFFLSRNNLTGNLPVSIGSLSKLEIMDVSSNSITGVVPSSYAGLTEIVGFALCYNKLYQLEDGLEPLYDRIKGFSCELYDNPWSCPLPSDVPASCEAVCSKCNTGSKHTECSACVADGDCGWCNQGPNCLEGSSNGPFDYQCKSSDWSYGSC